MTTSAPLTDTQLVLLSRASQRDDGLLVPLDTLRGGAARTVASRLLIAELVSEVPVGRDDPHWFRDEGMGRWVGLRVTAAGLRAIGLEAEEPDGAGGEGTAHGHPAGAPQASSGSAALPRAGSKRVLVVELLERPEGATLDDLVEATGWLPHTTRAALTGLRQRGYTLAKSKAPDGRTVYRISADAAPPIPKPGPTAPDSAAQTATAKA